MVATIDSYSRPPGVVTRLRTIEIHLPEGEIVRVEDWVPVSITVTKSQPLPLQFTNTPASACNPDGSYNYSPVVVGGVGPYTFEISGLPDPTFAFDSKTGTLSRPPQ